MDDDPYRNAITEALITQYYGQPGRGSREGDKVRAFGNVRSMDWQGNPYRVPPAGMNEQGGPVFPPGSVPQQPVAAPTPAKYPSYSDLGTKPPPGAMPWDRPGADQLNLGVPSTPVMPAIPNPQQFTPSPGFYRSNGAGTDPSIPPPVPMPTPPNGYYDPNTDYK